MNNIVFLDFDGVLNSTRSTLAHTTARPPGFEANHEAFMEACGGLMPYLASYTFDTIDPVAVDLVNRLLDKSGAKLVLSTSHRNMFLDVATDAYGSPDHLRLLNLYCLCIGLRHPVYSITEKLHVARGHEVQDWLDRHRQRVKNHVILDDSKEFDVCPHCFVWCDPRFGFTADNYYQACMHLRVVESQIIY